MERRFLADAMLGSLAKWLRVLGYDTYYQSRYRADRLKELAGDRVLLSRNRKTIAHHPGAVLIPSERLPEQIRQMKAHGLIPPPQEGWFSRCLTCNVLLVTAHGPESRADVPEYVFYERPGPIRQCPSCGRAFWPGTHRDRMMTQLREWGLCYLPPDSLIESSFAEEEP
jgi:hypothetical protein